MSRRLFYTDHYTLPLPEGHRFPIAKYRLVREALERDGLYEFVPAPLAKPEVIALAHEAKYVEQFVRGELPAQMMRRIGFPWSPELVKRTLGSVGGTLSATMDALDTGWAERWPAERTMRFATKAQGFVSSTILPWPFFGCAKSDSVERAAVIDLDVHQGDGTAEIFANDERVLTTSVHCRTNFPFRKRKSAIDVELEDATHDEEYLQVVDELLPKIREFSPQILYFQSGVDGLATDALGRLALSHAGLKERDRRVLSFARDNKIPLVITLGGGYSKPIEHTAEAHANTFRVAAEIFNGTTS